MAAGLQDGDAGQRRYCHTHVLSPPTRNSELLHIVERFTLDPETMSLKREYTATDPAYLAEPYASYDVMYLSEVPFQPAECVDMTPEFQSD